MKKLKSLSCFMSGLLFISIGLMLGACSSEHDSYLERSLTSVFRMPEVKNGAANATYTVDCKENNLSDGVEVNIDGKWVSESNERNTFT